ncbi:glycosyltransferase family 4 protein [Flavobacterium ponti]|uniref:Glycosyltransferase family 4 protein n=1 Tax=Flavobacterium ponti TaxID=665133 RepID=A0ABV9P5N4_9FLAO
MKISLLHPFSAKAIGLQEHDLLESHSKPHVLALQAISKKDEKLTFTIDYFTGSLLKKQKNIDGILKQFWPISYPFFKRHQWRSQFSRSHFNSYNTSIPDVTIINMSGHASKYIFKLAKRIKEKKKQYIAMIGGLHMSYDGEALNYYKNAHHIIVHTNYQKQELLKHPNFSNFDIRVLPLGIDTAIFKPVERIENKDFIITYVGRISRLKQIELAIEAIAYCKKEGIKNIQLNIIGPKSDAVYFDELNSLIEKLDCQDIIHFLGSISHQNLVTYYQNSDILALPSIHESFGMVMTEAMACEVPVIALKGSGGPDEIISNDEDGILTTEESYSQALFQLLSDKEKLKRMCINARNKVEKRFSLNTTIEFLHESIKSALQ